MAGVVVVRDQDFVGVAAPTAFQAQEALESDRRDREVGDLAPPFQRRAVTTISARMPGGACPRTPSSGEMAASPKTLKPGPIDVAYVQHAPMEPRAALAEWVGRQADGLDRQLRSRSGSKAELVRAFGVPDDRVRVIIPDFGGGFGGKHSGECAVEAARLAKSAGKPVRLVWTRAEEFTWAQFRPAGVIDAEASLDDSGRINVLVLPQRQFRRNQEVQTPYRAGKTQARYVESSPPLRHGSYRALAAAANTFGRECFMDELATLAGHRPARIPVRRTSNKGRLKRRPRQEAASAVRLGRIGRGSTSPTSASASPAGRIKGRSWRPASRSRSTATRARINVRHVCQAYECGKILNPARTS